MGRPKKYIPEDASADPSEFETRCRVIQAAKELFLAKGFKGVSMKDLAEGSKLTPAALYYYYPGGKEELFLAVLEFILNERVVSLQRAVEGGTNLEERLQRLTGMFLTGTGDAMFGLIRDVQTQVKDHDKQMEIWKRFRGDYFPIVGKVFQDAADAGELPTTIPATLLASLYLGMSMSLGHNPIVQGLLTGDDSVEKVAQTVVSILLNGVRGTGNLLAPF